MNIPGFIDLQVNGYSGINFNDPEISVEEILEAAEILQNKGTAGFLPTITTNEYKTIEMCVANVNKAIIKQGNGGNILGIHLEGPFISSQYGYRGAHPESAVIPPDIDWFKKLQKISEGRIKIVTLAPEYKNAVDFIKSVGSDIIVSVGHSNCTFEEIKKSVAAGLRMATHIGNGCLQKIDRHNNPIFNILACPELSISFIPDGFHLPEAFIRMIVNCRRIDQLIVVSDSVMHAGMEPGEYKNTSGIEVVLRNDGRLCLAADPEIMAGSSFNMMQCMNHLASLGIVDESTLWQVGFFNPLRILSLNPEKFKERAKNLRYNPESVKFCYQ